ncbi:LysR family transcriptional regulator [Massilia phyllosphaerae]|uniref:LysR family transcriptional regulator n=1 Tax=Massilia phyllosphaerae TaxID=3106034 RepID=UPI002B1CBCAD|nr:LysR substrate-binding domain-containing protein [Massilia sp. SGZ-792]
MEMLREMAIFAQVVDKGSFAATARHLGITTSAVSRHVARLEAHLGGRLLSRTTRALALTELGREAHAACARILSTAREVHALAGHYRAQPTGVLRLSAPVVFGETWLAPLLPSFLTAYPLVDVRLTLIDRNVNLVDDGVDLAIRIARDLAPGLVARPLFPLDYVLVASTAYLAEHGTPIAPSELVAHSCAYLGYGRFGPDLGLIRGAERATVRMASRVTINNSAALVALAEADGGIVLVPNFAAAPALASKRVQRVLADWTCDAPYTGTVYAVYTSGPHVALKVRAFIDYMIQAASPAGAG